MTLDHAAVLKALERAFNLGQTYWQQADSESYSQNAKAGATLEKFRALRDETLASLPAAQEPVAWMHPDGRVIPASTMETARRDGGATLSGVRNYTIALYAAPPATDSEDAARLAAVREIYAGMEGFIPQTASEAYCLRIIKQMAEAAMGLDKAREGTR